MSTATSPPPPADTTRSRSLGSRRARIALVAALAIAAAAVLLFELVRDGDNAPDRPALGQPRIMSAAELSSYAHSVGRPVYWAGPAQTGFQLEFTEVRGGRTFVRYLPAGVRAGDPRPSFTTVATYQLARAYASTSAAGRRPGAVLRRTAAGAAVLYYRKAPANVYVAYPNVDSLIEVFAPQPRAAQRLARSQSIAALP
jgi:hypothetical protein